MHVNNILPVNNHIINELLPQKLITQHSKEEADATMPVHLMYDRSLITRELGLFQNDAKGCQQPRTLHRLEPVCCCERCYACLANPLVGTLFSQEQHWCSKDVVRHDWFSLCPCASCDCDHCLEERQNLHKRPESTVICDSSPSLVHKRRLTTSSVSDSTQLPCSVSGRRPLGNIQQDAVVVGNDSCSLKKSDCCAVNRFYDDTCSWVQPPPNRTICHIIDDVTFERLTTSSPVLTRCCIASSHKQGTSRHLGKVKTKNTCVQR